MRGEVYGGRQAGEAADHRGASSGQGRARLQIGGRAGRGAHAEHFAHVSDAGGVEAERLVECRRALPRVERRAHAVRDEVYGGRQSEEVADDRGPSSVQGRGFDCRLWAGHGEERTWNMCSMSLTLEVSKLSG